MVLNKIDLGQEVNEIEGVAVSLLNAHGLADLKTALLDKLKTAAQSTGHAVISERHRVLLIQARDEAKQARAYLNENLEQKAALACDHLRSALEHLGHVTGRTYHDELLDNIFSRFCIGK